MSKSKTVDMNSISTLVIRLLLITVCAGLILGVVYSITKEPIAQQEAQTANKSRQTVLPAATDFESLDITALVADSDGQFGELQEVYRGVDESGSTVGYTMAVNTTGYSANLCLTVGIAIDGTVTGVDITSMDETPGLGANATKPEFLGQFVGTDGPLVVTKTATGTTGEIQALTGATLTSRGVTGAVNMSREFFETVLLEGGDEL